MRRLALAGALVALAACKGNQQEPLVSPGSGSAVAASAAAALASPIGVAGTLVVDGKPQPVVGCRPGRGFGTYVEVLTATGKLRFEDKSLYWEPDPKSVLRGDRLDCEKLDRSWGGGSRADGTAYFRGTLAFACTFKKLVVTGDLALDCGNITAEERASLDKNRASMKAEQAGQPAPAPAFGTPAQCTQLLAHLVELEFAKAALQDPTVDVEALKQSAVSAKSEDFLAECTMKTPREVVACALAATDLDGVARCDTTP